MRRWATRRNRSSTRVVRPTISPVSSEPLAERSRSAATAYVAAMGLSGAGITVSILAATAITTATDGGVHGALWTGAFLSIVFITKAAAVRSTAAWSRRFGPGSLLLWTTFLLIACWGGAGVLVILGAPATAVVLAVAPVDGLANGVFAVETPLLSKSFFSRQSLAAANARVSVVWGVACAAGAIGAGLLIDGAGAGWALLARAGLAIPLLLVIRRFPPIGELSIAHDEAPGVVVTAAEERRDGRRIKAGPAVRRVVRLAFILTAATAPVMVLIVPIAESLGHTSSVMGASIVLSAMSVGGLLAPAFVRMFERRLDGDRDPVLAALFITGLLLAAFAMVPILVNARIELVALAVVGLIFGGAEFASQSTALGQVVRVAGSFGARDAIASMKFSTSLAAPVGFVVWDLLLEETNGATAMLVAAALMILVSVSSSRFRTIPVT